MCRFFSPWFKSFDLSAMSCSAWRERRRLCRINIREK
jgi:hypothetical protein